MVLAQGEEKFMATFQRDFNLDTIIEHVRRCGNGAVSLLFESWVLPGEMGAHNGLRIAIRNRYLNLYVGGQSVAKISTSANGVRLKLHRKYYEGWKKGSAEAKSCGQQMVSLSDTDLRDPECSRRANVWVQTAAGYCGSEKLFVEDLIASNPNVIDMEIALPADDRLIGPDGKKAAPRMDLALVDTHNAPIAVNFWEAKMAENPDLRARDEIDVAAGRGAKVAFQLGKYETWLGLAGREDEVREAFGEAGSILVELAEFFGKSGPAVQVWSQLRDTSVNVNVVRRPGVVVGNYTPQIEPDSEDGNRSKSGSFGSHRKRLENLQYKVIEVQAANSSEAILPSLPEH